MACAKDVDEDFCPLKWWSQNHVNLATLSREASKIFLIQPSSASVERVFSLLKCTFRDHQDSSLQDYIEASLMLQFNS